MSPGTRLLLREVRVARSRRQVLSGSFPQKALRLAGVYEQETRARELLAIDEERRLAEAA